MNTFVLNITNRCNFTCEHCFREEASKEDLALDALEPCLPTLRSLGVQTLALTGGEPILHPRFPALLALLVKEGFRVGLVTNGWHTPRYLAALAPHKDQIAYVAISLDGHTASAHDALRARPGSFDAVLASIEAFHQAGYQVNISHVMSRHTASAHDLMALGNLLAELPVASLTLGAVVPTPRNGPVQLTTSPQLLLAAIRLLRRKLGNRIRVTPSVGLARGYQFCNNLQTMNDVALRYDGDVVFCCDSITSNRGAILGNVNREPLLTILRRHPERAAQVMAARLSAMAAGKQAECNDCAFCNQALASEPRAVRLAVV
ncbi:MAG: radical SAM protein [Myxococcales bacterium]|nr:radical SAM protein [Myxococcales bacterium]